MNTYTDILNERIVISLIILVLMLIILIQFFRLSKLNKMYRKLSDAFGKGEKMNYAKLVNRIIFSKELYTPRTSNEVVDMIHNYIKGLFIDLRVFIHITNDKEIAENILAEGFRYSENFHKSSEEISDNLVDLNYKLQIYKYYGKFVVIMCVPRNLPQDSKAKELKRNKDFFVENGICEYDQNEDQSYTLPSRFVKGYADISEMKIINNSLYQIEVKS